MLYACRNTMSTVLIDVRRINGYVILMTPDRTKPERAEGQTVVSISMSKDLLAAIDARAKALRLKRADYLRRLAYNDIETGGDFVLRSGPNFLTLNDHPNPNPPQR